MALIHARSPNSGGLNSNHTAAFGVSSRYKLEKPAADQPWVSLSHFLALCSRAPEKKPLESTPGATIRRAPGM